MVKVQKRRVVAASMIVCFAAVLALAGASELRRTDASIDDEGKPPDAEMLGTAGSVPQLGVPLPPPSGGDRFPGFREMSPEEASRIKRYPGFSVHPKMVSSLMGAKFPPIYSIPLAAIHDDIVEAGYEPNSPEGLMAIFGVRLASPDHAINYPNTAKLHVEFTRENETRSIELDMIHDGEGRFVFESPSYALLTAAQAIDSLGEIKSYGDRPDMSITRLSGIELDERSIDDMPPIGTLLIHHVYVGSLRIVTGYQWAGRPPGIPGSQQEGFVR